MTLIESGDTFRREGNLPAALKSFEQALTIQTKNRSARIRRAEVLRDLGHFDQAQQAYKALSADEPEKPDGLIGLGWCARRQSDLPSALHYFEAAVRLNPQNRHASLCHAEVLRELGRTGEAEGVYCALLTRDPAAAYLVYMGLGYCAKSKADHLAALEHFRSAVRAAPHERSARLQEAEALRELGLFGEAKLAYRKLIDDDPKAAAEGHLGLGHCARRESDLDRALIHFEAAVELAPQNRNARLRLAEILLALDRTEQAESVYQTLLAAFPKLQSTDLLKGLAECSRKRSDLARAVQYLDQAVSLAPQDRNIRLGRAQMLAQLGRDAEAEAAYLGLLSDAPQNYWAAIGLGKIARARNQRSSAAAYFFRATELQPQSKGAWFELITEHREQGNLEAAREALSHLIGRHPNDADAYTVLAQIERQSGARGPALEAFRRAYALNPSRQLLTLEIVEELWGCRRFSEAADALVWISSEAEPAIASGALLRLSQMARARGELREAFMLALLAQEKRPDAIGPYLELAWIKADSGDLGEALTVLRAAKNLPENNHRSVLLEAALLRRSGQLWEAHRTLSKAISEKGTNFALNLQLAQLEIGSGNSAEALEILNRIAPRNRTEHAELEYAKGMLAEVSMQIGAAADHYETAVTLNPRSAIMHSSLARVSLMRCDVERTRKHLARAAEIGGADRVYRGISANPLRNQVGLLLDEYVLRADGMHKLADLCHMPASERVFALCELVRRMPGYTPAALSLLTALREAGHFDLPHPKSEPTKIPRTVVQLLQGKDSADELKDYLSSWSKKNPDHVCQLFDDDSAQDFLSEYCADHIQTAYRNTNDWTRKADLFRLAYLFIKGGIFANTADLCRMPVSEWPLCSTVELVSWQDAHGALGAGFLCAIPQHPLIGSALEACAHSLNRFDLDMPWLATGPGLLSRSFAMEAVKRLAPGSRSVGLENTVILTTAQLFKLITPSCFYPSKALEISSQRVRKR